MTLRDNSNLCKSFVKRLFIHYYVAVKQHNNEKEKEGRDRITGVSEKLDKR